MSLYKNLIYNKFVYVALFAMLITVVSCKTQGKVSTELKPLELDCVYVEGELYQRAMKNFDRLETDIYYPENVFPAKHHPTSAGWPGDKEGRTILALVMEAKATHRTPKYLDEMIRILPEKLNDKGYLGAIQGDTIDEQQLSGHGWLLRALCEYYLWKKDPKVKTYIEGIINNLALPTSGHHKEYPINPIERVAGTGGMSGSSANTEKGWKLSTDVGCDFIFMDGVVQAYGLFPSVALKLLIEEMMGRFLEMDLVGMKAQTHATLTGLRAVLRYSEITGRKELMPEVEKRYKLYRELAMTENYENFNWFERPEWTEPCAIVDSYLLSVQLWQQTQNPKYMEDAQLIYYNAMGHTQRTNGGFGCDNCPGSIDNFLSVKADEAFWCCTMRGGEGLARAVEYSYFQKKDTLVLTAFNSGSINFKLKNSQVTISQKTAYPFDNKVTLTIEKLKNPERITLKFFAPSWIRQPMVTINRKPVKFNIRNSFVIVSEQIQTGDKVEYSFTMAAGVESVANVAHTPSGEVRLFYGPLLLGYKGESEITIPKNAEVMRNNDGGFQLKGSNFILSPVYHLMDAEVCLASGYRKQILFKQNQY